VVLRPFNIYGEGQDRHFLIPEILGQLRTGKEIVLKDLAPRRDFLYISDAIDAYVKAAEFDGPTYEIFNIGSGESFSVKEIAETMARLCGADVPIRALDKTRKGEIPETVADISKSAALLNWTPRVDLESGLRNVVES
jgi:nucleoside-diphosphate-sugar epimerase